ncbi:MAG: ABC transporter ATP-binding protein [Candidatus Saganbacteria bacterium]|nr:ABC transporter ATP-binding protein [Candidatus Saganbacteria bacterium]
MQFAIEAKKLTKKFGTNTAVNGLDLQIKPGEIFGLVGPDGAGKSTTMRLISTAMTPTTGSAFVLGFNTLTEEEEIRDRIGYMPQRFALYGELTVNENIDFFAEIYGVPKKDIVPKRKELLEFTGMAKFGDRRGRNLSGGMQKKLALACNLIHTPEIIMLDEPTLGVDPISRREFWRILYGLTNVTIVVTTPYMDEAERCSRIALIREGHLLNCDTPENIKQHYGTKSLEEAFIKAVETGS